MTDWVLDCSMALAWGLPDEGAKAADAFLAGLPRRSVLHVPALWWYEVSNALVVAQRRRRLSEADAVRLMELFARLPLRTDLDLAPVILLRLRALASEHGLSAYDAAYLELAQRLGLALATLDRRLSDAARRAAVRVFDGK